MKRLWIAAVFLSIVTGLCIWSQIVVSTKTQELTSMVSSARFAVENGSFSLALERAEKLGDHWREDDVLFSVLMQHNELDDLNIRINMLPSYAMAGEKQAYLDCCDEIAAYLEHIRESERADFGNIF